MLCIQAKQLLIHATPAEIAELMSSEANRRFLQMNPQNPRFRCPHVGQTLTGFTQTWAALCHQSSERSSAHPLSQSVLLSIPFVPIFCKHILHDCAVFMRVHASQKRARDCTHHEFAHTQTHTETCTEHRVTLSNTSTAGPHPDLLLMSVCSWGALCFVLYRKADAAICRDRQHIRKIL